jgi:hypothetical protein
MYLLHDELFYGCLKAIYDADEIIFDVLLILQVFPNIVKGALL